MADQLKHKASDASEVEKKTILLFYSKHEIVYK